MRSTNIPNPGSGLKWLLSETLVIVLGVLLALGLDDFWTARQERDFELQYLRRVQADVRADIDYIDEVIRERLDIKLQSLAVIAPIVRGQEPVPENVESFLRNVALGGLLGASSTHWVRDTTFEDLKSTGNFRLIRNVDLRQKISRYYAAFDTLYGRSRDRQTGYAAYVHALVPAELRDDMGLADMEEFGIERALTRFTSAEFQDLLNQEYNYAYFTQRLNFRATSVQLMTDLEEHIRQLNGGS